MFEEQITESIEAGAPDITYSGNEGPKSPQQMQQMQQMQMAQAQEDYKNYVMGQEEAGGQILSFEQWLRMTYEASRQGAAYGGIMGIDGRRKYGVGSWLKKKIRNLIPNEVADIAVKAAPFIAPFNPIAGGLMAGIGGFDQTGKIGSSLKSGLMNYGMGQLARGIGGGRGNLQGNPFKAGPSMENMGTGFGKYFSNPMQDTGGLGEILDNMGNSKIKIAPSQRDNISKEFILPKAKPTVSPIKKLLGKIGEYVPTSLSDFNPMSEGFGKKALGALGIYKLGQKLLGPPEQVIDDIMSRGGKLDIDDIRTRVTAAYKDPSGKLLADLRLEFPFLGTAASKNTAIMAQGGRIGYGDGGLTEYESYRLKNMGYDTKGGTVLEPFGGLSVLKDILRVNKAMGGRIGFAEGGGIMDLDGMELDYRAEGGFVPIGEEEKADDVPARLSVNEFVFTADAVRNAGGGDIDQGAEIMERVMKNLEQGGQISEETQGMSGAQEMFNVSERLSEVV